MKDILNIEDGVLEECTDKSVTSVVIPEGVTEIGYDAFNGCKSLSSVEFGGTVAQWEAVEGKLNMLEDIPATVVKCADGEWQKPILLVEDGVAVKCFDKSAASVVIPEGVTEIGNLAFYGCKSLESVEFGGTVAQWDAVKGKRKLPEHIMSVKCADGEWQKPVVLVENRVAVKCLDESATSVVIPEGVTKIGYGAFWGCKSLESVAIPSSVTEIGGSAFCDCESLSSVVIPPSVAEIGEGAFYECESLASVVIPPSVTEIGEDAFEHCNINELSHPLLTIKNGVAIKDNVVQYRASQSGSITIPEGVTAIGKQAFYGCKLLSSVVIPEGVTAIGHWAFSGCKSLSSVAIPPSVKQIGERAFWGCESLSSIEFGGTAAQWEAVKKGNEWKECVPATTVKCSNGEAALEE